MPNADPIPVVTTMKGKPYTEDHFHGIVAALKGASTANVEHAMGLWKFVLTVVDIDKPFWHFDVVCRFFFTRQLQSFLWLVFGFTAFLF